MKCPPGLATILTAMIRTGVLNIRAAAWTDDPGRCATEADHIHNLPDLLDDYTDDGLAFYWNVERPTYIARVGESGANAWAKHWTALGTFAERVGASSTA